MSRLRIRRSCTQRRAGGLGASAPSEASENSWTLVWISDQAMSGLRAEESRASAQPQPSGPAHAAEGLQANGGEPENTARRAGLSGADASSLLCEPHGWESGRSKDTKPTRMPPGAVGISFTPLCLCATSHGPPPGPENLSHIHPPLPHDSTGCFSTLVHYS